MNAARLRPGLLVLAALVAVAGLACARPEAVGVATGADPAPVVADDAPGPGAVAMVARSATDRLRAAVRHHPVGSWMVVAAHTMVVAGAMVTIGGGVPAVPCRTTVHVRRRGPPSCA